jgi:uncharacterized protein YutE (UPF0331/DUF86 family)
MPLELYQAETARIAAEQAHLIAQAKSILQQGRELSPLEQSGVLHALQILIENAIGKAKQWLKAQQQPVPISGYDAFRTLLNINLIPATELPDWNAAIGLRNRLVHDYMNIDFRQIEALLMTDKTSFIVRFLNRDYPNAPESTKP